MRTLTQLIIGLTSATFLFALSFEGITGIGASLDSNRALVESRVRLQQTNPDTGAVKEPAVEAGMSALDRFNETVKIERALYLRM